MARAIRYEDEFDEYRPYRPYRERGFPGPTEVLGLMAGLAPFAMAYLAVTLETAEWVRVGGGVLSVLLGFAGFFLVGSTRFRRRMVRVLAAMGLIALGIYHLAGGLPSMTG